ncbi:DNA methylase [Spirochaetia bacterium]|nr:DNA methylase [Spirochaetia bacterium]
MINQSSLFATHITPAVPTSGKLFDEQLIPGNDTPVTCLGKTFANDTERRAYFTEELRKKLADTDFRKIEGFPIGKDEDILGLSDPPYYTACPNPWIADFIAGWDKEKSPRIDADGKLLPYHREPFAADVSEGKNDPIYNAHSYHTKVPHKAIMRYILHYTEPGDIVFDGFCGTGMTGVAAQMCGNKEAVQSLGYTVENDGTIFQDGKPFSRLGARLAVLNDLSPAATFIAYNYNTPVDVVQFENEAKRILQEVENECGWMYETMDTDGKTKGKINYTVWSDVFVCPDCTKEIVFWEAAVDKDAGEVRDEFPCPHCGALLTKRRMNRAWVSKYDSALKETIKQAKQVPVLINYTVNGKRAEKKPDSQDLALIDKIENSEIPYWFPTDRMMEGGETRRNDPIGITHVHHFYTKRNLYALAALLPKCNTPAFRLMFQSIVATLCSRIVRYNMGKRGNGSLSGTLYIGSLNAEAEITKLAKGKTDDFSKAFLVNESALAQCQSLENTSIGSNSVDYIFIDPPFGANLNYSELNFIWESWLKVITNNKQEAIENPVQEKGPTEYRQLMTACFKEAYRVLKPGHWMTVEFSNTKASVWNGIQTALSEAGFIVANVSALDKQQGSFKAVTTPTAVKQDLVISSYKPNGGFEERFFHEAKTPEGVWDFVRTHLKYLPVVKVSGDSLQPIPERDPRILFDQMVAYYVRKNYLVPISSQNFQAGLPQRFIERDGMYFLAEQVTEYDSKKLEMGNRVKSAELFVLDEATAIQWLRQSLTEKPQTFQQIHPHFMQEISGWNKNETQLELGVLLEQNFLKDDKDFWYVPDVNKASDLEKLREKALLKEFAAYTADNKKLKVFRMEAVRAGFKKAWQDKDYDTIINVAERIPGAVLDEDAKLLMWYDQAQTRKGV